MKPFSGKLLIALLLAGLTCESVLAQAIAPVRAIRSQTVIGPEDVEVLDQTVTGGVTGLSAVVGQEARVTLYPGRPILVGQVGAPAVVERNQLVRMIFRQGPLSITDEGRVLERAGEGERVKVMNLTSRQIVTGSVKADGSIEVVK